MLRVVQQFDKDCSCHLQGGDILVGHFWQHYVVHGVGRALDVMNLIGGSHEGADIP
jgi:hypothetical protein